MPQTPFDDLPVFIALPQLTGLALAPDGSRLVTTVATLDPERTGRRTALWEIDPAGERPARRLTYGPKGECDPAFTPDGELLFRSARPDPDKPAEQEPPAALWGLPQGGEARLRGTRPGGFTSLAVASAAGTLLVTSPTLPGGVTADDDRVRRKDRTLRKNTAILHDGYPVRFWDHDLGPGEPRLLVGCPAGPEPVEWRDLTPAPGRALLDTRADISPDGGTVVTSWYQAEAYGRARYVVVAFDVASGDRRVLLDDPGYDFGHPRISPDGRTVAAIRARRPTPHLAPRKDVVTVPLAGGSAAEPAPDWERWPTELAWTPDSAALVVAADEAGRAPLFRIGVPSGGVLRLTGDHGAYTDPVVSPDGRSVYALRSAVDAPPAPVRLAADAAEQAPVLLPGPAGLPELPGTLTEVTATAGDGSALRAWLVLPAIASPQVPVPLLLWVHGGPLSSWNAWHWRWNPWLAAAKGYAVLLPDPALSTGYGQEFVQRGWGAWGAAPYTDLLALADAAEALPEIDETRTAAMGGSFGGYMANWIAGHTDRFRAIVTHASLWALEQFGTTTDVASYWLTEMTPEMAAANSPHLHADAIRTPMLVIHGDKDYRVPIGEALRLWWDLCARRPDPAANPHRFLYFPDEGHWIGRPQHTVVWYETIFEFLARHLADDG